MEECRGKFCERPIVNLSPPNWNLANSPIELSSQRNFKTIDYV